jgi:Fe-S cluster assembly iron-binding protein IscA
MNEEGPMLQCTPAAATALAELRERQEVPDTFGLRVFAVPNENGLSGVRMAFTDGPAAGDEIAESNGQRFFVAKEVAPRLDGLALDASPDVAPSGLVLRAANPG